MTELKLTSCCELLEAFNSIYENKFKGKKWEGEEVNEAGMAFNQISYALLYILNNNGRLCDKCQGWFKVLKEKGSELEAGKL